MNKRIFRKLVASVVAVVSLGSGVGPVGARHVYPFDLPEGIASIDEVINGHGPNKGQGVLLNGNLRHCVSLAAFYEILTGDSSNGKTPLEMFDIVNKRLHVSEKLEKDKTIDYKLSMYFDSVEGGTCSPVVGLVGNVRGVSNEEYDFVSISEGGKRILLALTPEEAFAIKGCVMDVDKTLEQFEKDIKDKTFEDKWIDNWHKQHYRYTYKADPSNLSNWIEEFRKLEKEKETSSVEEEIVIEKKKENVQETDNSVEEEIVIEEKKENVQKTNNSVKEKNVIEKKNVQTNNSNVVLKIGGAAGLFTFIILLSQILGGQASNVDSSTENGEFELRNMI